MKEQHYNVTVKVFEGLNELTRQDQLLLEKAIAARENAYAPYSNFKVGAAALLDNGEIVLGSNQENASFPSGLCAERVAVFQAGARFPGVPILSLAISAGSDEEPSKEPAAPCGNCRQSIYEYEHKQGKPIRVILRGSLGPVYIINAISDLLPLGFNSSQLNSQ
ncbi:MAG: cytidine deaminase [Bacteroidia bacterium]|nr:cytidine deaminase [Bacteroidia bacterium]